MVAWQHDSQREAQSLNECLKIFPHFLKIQQKVLGRKLGEKLELVEGVAVRNSKKNLLFLERTHTQYQYHLVCVPVEYGQKEKL